MASCDGIAQIIVVVEITTGTALRLAHWQSSALLTLAHGITRPLNASLEALKHDGCQRMVMREGITWGYH